MFLRLITCFCMLLLFAAVSWAADPFLGTWKPDIERSKQQIMKNLPPGVSLQDLPLGTSVTGDSIKVETYRDGYKLTQTIGKDAHITIVDFKTGVTPVRNAQGEEIDRVKVVRISSTEIEATSLKYGGTLNYRIIEGGNELEAKGYEQKGQKPSVIMYYKRGF